MQEDPNIVRTIQTRLIDLQKQLEASYTEDVWTLNAFHVDIFTIEGGS